MFPFWLFFQKHFNPSYKVWFFRIFFPNNSYLIATNSLVLLVIRLNLLMGEKVFYALSGSYPRSFPWFIIHVNGLSSQSKSYW